MTPAQLQKIHDDIAADPVFRDLAHTVDNAMFIADEYNKQAVPDFWVWKTSLAEKEIYEATVEGASWNWATYKGQSVQDRDAWTRMMTPQIVNPALAQTRAGWQAIFGGQGASQAQVNYLLALGRRFASRGEKLLAGGTGSTASPALMTFEGFYTWQDIDQAWNIA